VTSTFTQPQGEYVLSTEAFYPIMPGFAWRGHHRMGWAAFEAPLAGSSYVTGRRAPHAEWLLNALRDLTRLTQLPAGWDGYGAKRVSTKAFERAVQVLANPDLESAPPPLVTATTTGGVVCEWRGGKVELQIEVNPTGVVDTYIVDGNSGTEWETSYGEEPDGLAKWAWKLRLAQHQ
jgi:hypothetical protein